VKKLIIISLLLFVGSYGFGQILNDTIHLTWDNDIIKYQEHYQYEHILDTNGVTNGIVFLIMQYYDSNGTSINEDKFKLLYGETELNALLNERDSLYDIIHPQKEIDSKWKDYTEFIIKADNFFFEKNYKKAQEYYKRAISIKPNEEYPAIQLKKIKKLK
jgi:hypothetical protein